MFELLRRDGRNPGNLIYRRLTRDKLKGSRQSRRFHPFLHSLQTKFPNLSVEGSINQTHRPDEYVELKQVSRAIDIIHKLVQFHCL